jgi:hypothetical protein
MSGARTTPRFSRDAVVRDLRVLASRIGRPLLAADLDGEPRLREAIRQHFGKLPSALKAAGLPSPASRPQWSLPRVINELRQLHREGVQLTEPRVNAAGRADLVGAARKYAGSFTAARKLARLAGPQPTWSKARVLAEIRECVAQGIENLPKPLQAASAQHFGSIRAAREAAGAPSRLKIWSREGIIEALRENAARGEPIDANLWAACKRHFGSTAAAQRAAGVPSRSPSLLRASRADILKEVRRHVRRTGAGLPRSLAHACRHHFGSVAAARAAAGVAPAQRTWSKRAIVDELRQRVARGEAIDQGLAGACRSYFGSLNAAREAARVPTVKKRWTRDSIVAELRRRRGVFDGPLRRVAHRLFGSLEAAYAAAGLPPRKAAWTPESVIAGLAAGRRDPRLLRAAQYHFGSLAEGLRAAKLEPRPTWDADRVLREIRRYPSVGVPDPLTRAAVRYFGSVAEARRAAGIAPPQRSWSAERVIEELRSLGRAAAPVYLKKAVLRYFDSMVEARLAAGVSRTRTREQTLADLRRLGDVAVDRQLARDCRKHFGSVEAARALARRSRGAPRARSARART